MSEANSEMTLHRSVSDVTVSHAIVILLTLTCQLAPKSNSHISQSFVASVYKPAFFQCSSSSTCAAMYPDLQNKILQVYIRTSLVCFIRDNFQPSSH